MFCVLRLLIVNMMLHLFIGVASMSRFGTLLTIVSQVVQSSDMNWIECALFIVVFQPVCCFWEKFCNFYNIFFLFPVFIRKIIRAATKGEIAIAKDEGGRSIGSEAESQSLCSSKSTPCSERWVAEICCSLCWNWPKGVCQSTELDCLWLSWVSTIREGELMSSN